MEKIKDKPLTFSSNNSPNRAGWNQTFKKMAHAGDDKLLDPEIFELESDRKDWKWYRKKF